MWLTQGTALCYTTRLFGETISSSWEDRPMSGLTPLGKFLRKLRIDRGELLRDMSSKLGVAMSFLSAVENGKKSMPSEWAARLTELYAFSKEQKAELDTAVAASEKGVDVKFEGLPEESKRLSVAFARKIKHLTADEQKILQGVLF